ncbi:MULTISPECIES: acyl-CoA dehydrogenase family protein [unclassified Frankia]|uniref:acyl-CoA dehydrogenase family protein n=1 Tax=unclassified Frankia TaxID=2632575 RepID=UPI00200F805D|nr:MULTISPECIES: acyl-CoA dehydrogenase family protein [unclassified Frankia]MCK9896330.1 acyl-CoA dehydrogenase family protein [Frankia sp. AgB32]MCL9798335.1 acyl-CoA dehydrogenase family protein [Frankia sp. AgKG'84/4]
MKLGLTADQDLLVGTTRKFLQNTVPTAVLRALRDDPSGYPGDYWTAGAELGWTSLLVAEEHGGGSVSDDGLGDLALVAHEFGRHAAPGPLLATNVVASALSRIAGASVDDALPRICAGEMVAAWCLGEPVPHAGLGEVATTAVADGGDWVLSGTKGPVEHAAQAELLLVTARTGDGLTQFLVPAECPGVTVTPLSSLDTVRRFARVHFDDVRVPSTAVLGEVGQAADEVERQLREALVIQTAEMVGAMDRAFELTVAWAGDRYSFGRPLSSYQALKHRFADMKMWLEASHAVADAAAAAVGGGGDQAGELVSVAKSYIGQYGPALCQDCVQLHGGIGLTFEHDLHLYLRRVSVGSALLGTAREHRLRIAGLLEARERAAVVAA